MEGLVLYKEFDENDEYLYVFIPDEYDLDGCIGKLNSKNYIEVTLKNNPEYSQLFLNLEKSVKNLNIDNRSEKVIIAELLNMYNIGRNNSFAKLRKDLLVDAEIFIEKIKGTLN